MLAKRDWEGQHIQQFKGQKGIEIIPAIIEGIAKGDISSLGLKAKINWRGFAIALARKSSGNVTYWLLTGDETPTHGYTYVLESAVEWGGGDDPAHTPTHTWPTLARPYMGAANSGEIIKSNLNQVNAGWLYDL